VKASKFAICEDLLRYACCKICIYPDITLNQPYLCKKYLMKTRAKPLMHMEIECHFDFPSELRYFSSFQCVWDWFRVKRYWSGFLY
jgi:hypothetical protein